MVLILYTNKVQEYNWYIVQNDFHIYITLYIYERDMGVTKET